MSIKLKIRTRLIISFSIIAIVAATIGFTGYYIMNEVVKQMKITKNAVKAFHALTDAQQQAYEFKLKTNGENHTAVIQEIDLAMQYVKANKDMYDWAENIERANAILESGKKYKSFIAQFAEGNKNNKADLTLWEQSKVELNTMLNLTDGMTSGVISVINYAVNTGIKIILLAVGITVILIFILTILLTRGIHKQLGGEPHEIAEIAERISNGELTFGENSSKKYQGVYASMNKMRSNLNQFVIQLNQTAHALIKASEQMAVFASQIMEGADKQGNSVQGVSASINSMNQAIVETNKSASKSKSIALQTVEKVSTDYSEAEKVLSSLSELGGRLTIINDIARQTNILSLNASVEAARAGHHGKGFAVVATEIGHLASQSGQAAEEFSNESDRIAKSTVKQLSDIVPEIKKILTHVEEITNSAVYQQSEAEKVNDAVNNLSNIAELNTNAAHHMNEKANQLKQQAETLEDMIGFFKI